MGDGCHTADGQHVVVFTVYIIQVTLASWRGEGPLLKETGLSSEVLLIFLTMSMISWPILDGPDFWASEGNR